MSEPPQNIDTIFINAIEIESPSERKAYLDRACGADGALRRRVDRFLDAHFRAGQFLESPPAGLPVEPLNDLQAGTAVGPYTLLERIGEGGMGVVFRAHQSHPVERDVALKIVRLGMDTKQVIARFDAERQALAVMDHPNIAKVFDAGATDTGRPYFVMELVGGEPVTRFCDEHRLSISARLNLFVQICRAVQHAHQKGLIHRDIKPSNVLATMQDGRPFAKVIDFGIAKATATRPEGQTLVTEDLQLVGTPQYMSPEQAQGSQDIDTRSDIYSLGVLLYELLTGATPFDPRKLRSAAQSEVQRIIREVDPPRPSTRLSTLDTLQTVAEQRGTEPRKLSATLHGELDWIVMMAIEKDRGKRYETADALAADVTRHLENKPVSARPPTNAYLLKKFVRRNRGPVLASAVVLLVMIAGTIATTLGFLEARRQRDDARAQRREAEQANENTRAINRFLTEEILGAANPRVARGREISVKEALDNASERISGMFADQPLTEAAVRNTLAVTYFALGRADSALIHAQIALDLRRRELGNQHRDTLESINNLGLFLRGLGRIAEAETLWREAVDTGRRTFGPDDPMTVLWTFNLAHLVEDRGNAAEAERMYREVLAIWRVVPGEDDSRTLAAMNRLGGLLMLQGRLDEADPLLVAALERRRSKLGSDHMDTLNSINDLGLLRRDQGRLDECEVLFREALEGYRRVLGPQHPFTIAAMNNMGTLLTRLGRHADAEAMLREAVEQSSQGAGRTHPRTLIFLLNLGTALSKQGKFAEAEEVLLEAERGMRTTPGVAPARHRKVIEELVSLYTAWDKSEPGRAHDQKVRDWQEKLASTQPAATQPAAR